MSVFIFIGTAFVTAGIDIPPRLTLSHDSETLASECRALLCKYKCHTIVMFSTGDRINQHHLSSAGIKVIGMSQDLQSVTSKEKKEKEDRLSV